MKFVLQILNANDTSFFTSEILDSIPIVDSRILSSLQRDRDVPSCQVNEKNGPDEVMLSSISYQQLLSVRYFVSQFSLLGWVYYV
jgi:hypothetical protein